MNNKSWYASKGVWGGIIAVLAGVLPLVGVNLTGDDQTVVAEGLAAIGAAVAAIIGGGVAIWGRLKAKKPIGKSGDAGTLAALLVFALLSVCLFATPALAGGFGDLISLSLVPMLINTLYAVLAMAIALLCFWLLDLWVLRSIDTIEALAAGNRAVATVAGALLIAVAIVIAGAMR